jgi:hypothetical protein
MTAFEVGAAIVAVSLAIGIVVGVLIVIALPQIRYYRRARRYLDHGGWEELPPPEDNGNPPHWPGN